MPAPIAVKLRVLREERGLTQKEAAELANVSHWTLYYLESGKRSLLTVLGDEPPQLRKAEHSPLGVMGLHQPVAVEQDATILSERDLSLLIAHPCHKPKRHPSGPKFLGLTVTMQVRQVVACVGVAQGAPPSSAPPRLSRTTLEPLRVLLAAGSAP
jgi:transcriptional regulator with XRE-family HTH domain